MNDNGMGKAQGIASDAKELGLEDCAAELSDCRYLMVVPIPFHQAADGSVWLDDLWHRDLMRHLDYISDLTVLAPRRPADGVEGLVKVEGAPALRFRGLPWGQTAVRGILLAPVTLLAAVKAVLAADIVHSGAAGWPFPPGLFVNPVAVLARKPLVIVVESAFWRLSGPGPHSLKARMRARLVEAFARWSVRKAALSVFTHEGYRDSLAPGLEARSIVTPATWITAGDVLDEAAAEAAWDAKSGPVRVILPARLTEGKGVALVLDALSRVGAEPPPVALDVIGDGPLRQAVAEAAARLGPGRLRLLDPVPYGAPFLGLLRGYHAALVPSITDEQPRVLFDAAAQALPVLASDTEGHRGLIEDGVNGWRFQPDNPDALLAALKRAGGAPMALRKLGLKARAWAESRTHDAMHLARARRLVALRPRRPAVRAALPTAPASDP
jgi:glycosyltransferase involved in cell wall biosynthesis